MPKVQGVHFIFAARHLYHTRSLQSPGHFVTTAVLSTAIKGTNCISDTITSRHLTAQPSSRDSHYSCSFVRILLPSRLVSTVWSQNGTFYRPAIISIIFQIIHGVIYYCYTTLYKVIFYLIQNYYYTKLKYIILGTHKI